MRAGEIARRVAVTTEGLGPLKKRTKRQRKWPIQEKTTRNIATTWFHKAYSGIVKI